MLQSEGLCARKSEEPLLLIEWLTIEGRERLKEGKLKYFVKQVDTHIIYLLSKSRLGLDKRTKKCWQFTGSIQTAGFHTGNFNHSKICGAV